MARLHYFIGDVHGCFDSLRRLEDRIAKHAAKEGGEPHIVLLGDLVDRGPDSAAVVKHARLGQEAGTHETILGNHEELMLQSLDAYRSDLMHEAKAVLPPEIPAFEETWTMGIGMARWLPLEHFMALRRFMWIGQGGHTALASWGGNPDFPETWNVDPADIAFLCGLAHIWENDDVIATHALASTDSLHIMRDPTAPLEARRMAGHELRWRRELPLEKVDRRQHVSGHTPFNRARRKKRLGLVQVDTGACFGGRLSAWCAESDRILSVASELAGL